MANLRETKDKEFYPRLCSSTLFFTVLRLKKKKSGNQDECFKDFLSIIDPLSVEGIPESTLHRYSSDCKNANLLPKDCGYIRFGDQNVCKAFRDEMKSNPQDILKRVKAFTDKYFAPNSHKQVVCALLRLIDDDKSIDEHNRSFYVNPGFIPSLKKEFVSEKTTIYFYNFLIGVWFYVYYYYSNSEEGKDTIKYWTEHTKPYTADKVKKNLDENLKFDKINILYATEELEPDISSFDLEDDEGVIASDGQKVETVSDRFSNYVSNAYENYRNKRGFLDTKERPFRDFYVCNDVCQRIRAPLFRTSNGELKADYPEKQLNRARSNIMINDLGRNFSVFSGIGGMGKSMLLLKFLLDEVENYKSGGRVPIMITLRKYKPDEKSLEMLLATELKRFDPSLQLSDLYYLLEHGRAVCLLDGFDEIDKDYIHDFQDELDVMKDGYKKAYFLMSSRDIPEIRTLNHYFEYDLQNLNLKQACELIAKLDPDRVNDELKSDFIKKLRRDSFHFNRDEKRNFVGNPLFLSLMIRTYDMINDIPPQRYIFYEKTYVAMASEYDARTKRMTRPFFTGLNEKTFHMYFAEFCALSYADSKYEFSRDLMLDYFYQVVKDNDLKIDPELFIKDVTEKLCIVYKDGGVYEFIHRSFQEYFAASYFLSMLAIDKDLVLETLKVLDSKIKEDETLFMMYGMNKKSMEKYVILPFLEEMFAANNPEQDYKDFLRNYYSQIEYVTDALDEDMCNNDDQSSAMFYFIKKQYDIDHGYISSYFEDEIGYADDFEEYFWLEERWFSYDGNSGNMRLVRKDEIPSSFYEANDIDHICDRGFLCVIDVDNCITSSRFHSESTFDIIMSPTFPLREEFDAFKELYEKLKMIYDESANTPKRRLGLRRN